MAALPKVLFVLKYRQEYGAGTVLNKSSGLLNSASFMFDMLSSKGYTTKLVQVIDNNDIDREVTIFRPDIVIVEALWVVPDKYEVLTYRHPTVKWVVRLHSELPFLSNEGVAMSWINGYVKHPNVFISTNSTGIQYDLTAYMEAQQGVDGLDYTNKLLFLPNYYPLTSNDPVPALKNPTQIQIGCFGAIRPLKNHLVQASAAVQYAESRKIKCYFHINSSRLEGVPDDSILLNLRSFFAAFNGKHELVEHGWLDHPEFTLLVKQMDLGMQVSLSETFNIVSADFVNAGIPIVTSQAIDWMPKHFTADTPTDSRSIMNAIKRTMFYYKNMPWFNWQKYALKKYVERTQAIWIQNLSQI